VRFAVRTIGSSGNLVRRTGGPAVGIIRVEVSRMTIKHEVWLADALAGSAMLFALYLILLEFSKAKLP
jgi:hypothetical protein